jgi:fumarate hydratase subunit beta
VPFSKKRGAYNMNIPELKVTENSLASLKEIHAGKWILYSGEIITIRDSSQSMLIKHYKKEGTLPFEIKNKIIMYAAPTEDTKNIVIGPTTSTRMDNGLDFLLQMGAIASIGKGNRTEQATLSIKKHKAPYMILMSGVSAYLSRFFSEKKILAFEELGPEAVYTLTASDLPLLIAIDSYGKSIFK